jgi:hypothetical protein
LILAYKGSLDLLGRMFLQSCRDVRWTPAVVRLSSICFLRVGSFICPALRNGSLVSTMRKRWQYDGVLLVPGRDTSIFLANSHPLCTSFQQPKHFKLLSRRLSHFRWCSLRYVNRVTQHVSDSHDQVVLAVIDRMSHVVILFWRRCCCSTRY